jgi:HSP20 family protein
MLTMTRFSPTSDLLRERFNRMFEQTLPELFGPLATGEDVGGRWLPAVDIRETPDALEVIAELPGLTKEDVNITLENGVLTLSGERKFEKDVKQENYHRIERAYGRFTRSFTLPSNVAGDRVAAAFKDGVLRVTLPKQDEAKPRKIEIK